MGAQVKADAYEGYDSVKLKYGIFSFYDPFEGECKAYADIGDDDDGRLAADYDTSSRQKWAQSLAIITILILTSSIICASVLLFCTFSPKIKKLNQLLLIIALVTSYWGSAYLYQLKFNDDIKTFCKQLDDDCKIIPLGGFSIIKKNLCLKIMTLLRRLTRMLPPKRKNPKLMSWKKKNWIFLSQKHNFVSLLVQND